MLIINPYRFGAGAAFTPLDIPDLAAWYDGDDISTLWQDLARTIPVVSNGNVVGAWDDKSGNGHHVLQLSGTEKPIFVSPGQNGKSVILGVSDDFLEKSGSPLSQDDNVSIFWVGNATADNTIGGVYTNSITAEDDRIVAFIDSRTAGPQRIGLKNETAVDIVFADLTSDLIGTEFNQETLVLDGLDIDGWLNGAAMTGDTASGAISTANDGIRLFAQHGVPPITFHIGSIAEFIIVNATVSTSVRQQTEAYLKARWATP